jgi:hypothetical protein
LRPCLVTASIYDSSDITFYINPFAEIGCLKTTRLCNASAQSAFLTFIKEQTISSRLDIPPVAILATHL